MMRTFDDNDSKYGTLSTLRLLGKGSQVSRVLPNDHLKDIQRYPRVIVALILSPLLSRTLNFWATALFMEVLTFDTQIYLRELLGLEKLLDC